MKKYIIILCLFSTGAFAQLKDYNINLGSRYDRTQNTDGTLAQNRIQDRIKIGFTYDVNGLFQIVGLAATGPSYGNNWNYIHDFNQVQNSEQKLYFRRLYLEKLFGNTQVQLGSLDGIDSIGSTGINSSGWVDGIHLNVNKNGQKIKVRIGSLYDVKNPDLFTRKRKLNFAEIEVSKTYFKNLLVSAGYEHYNDDYLKGKMSLDMKIAGKEVLKLVAKVLVDVQNGGYNYDLGAQWDIMDTFLDDYKGMLKLDIYASRLDPKMHTRNALYSAYFQDGNSFNIKLSGKIDKNGRYNWFLRDALGKKNRFDAGIAIKLKK